MAIAISMSVPDPPLTCTAEHQRWRLAEPFVIARGTKTVADIVHVMLSDGTRAGYGECVPYGHYGETVECVLKQVSAWQPSSNREQLMCDLAAGAARNAVDCALWDLQCKVQKQNITQLLGPDISRRALPTAFTLSLATPDDMAAAAAKRPDLSFFKLKLGGDGLDGKRMAAVRTARTDARLVGDANESWRPDDVEALLLHAAGLGFEMIEQPLAQHHDAALAEFTHPLPICADESAHVTDDLAGLRGRYDAINIKLDKTGGLTEALRMKAKAQALGLKIMIGSMVSTSLAIAPAFVLATDADWVDLDSPLLLARDRDPGFRIVNGRIEPSPQGLWGDAA